MEKIHPVYVDTVFRTVLVSELQCILLCSFVENIECLVFVAEFFTFFCRVEFPEI